MLGHYVRRLAEAGLVGVLTATSPRAARAARRAEGRGHESARDRDPEPRRPLVADVSMGAVTWGDVVAGLATEEQLVPFGGEQWHKAFALAVGLQLLVDALVREPGYGRCCSSRGRRPIRCRRCARRAGIRLPGDSWGGGTTGGWGGGGGEKSR